MEIKPKYGFYFNLQENDAIRMTAARECGYSIPDIVKMGIGQALAQTRKVDGQHLSEREE